MVELNQIAQRLSAYFRGKPKPRAETPLKGFQPHSKPVPHLDSLSDADLEKFNSLLPWRCFTIDGHGRRVGAPASSLKRSQAQRIPDPKVVTLNELFALQSKRVTEVGCFEGVHTISLCEFGARVTALDARVENVAKTLLRSHGYGHHPQVFHCNVEEEPTPREKLKADVLFHVGVLYHLRDPIKHLLDLKSWQIGSIFLDTHVFDSERGEQTAKWEGSSYRFTPYQETHHKNDPFSGMYNTAKWLEVEFIIDLLRASGLSNCKILSKRKSRNGNRITLFAHS